MKVVGIIAEYNPFHRGHAYHLARARQISGADYALVVMSGNYVQRGAPAMFDKYIRAEAALKNGADLVLELPPCTATGSAEYFSRGAVELLARSGVVTDLCFGSECGDLSVLSRTARILAKEPAEYRQQLRLALKKGEPYPKARARALSCCDGTLSASFLQEPNNQLGLEYLKALYRLDSGIIPHTIYRQGTAYHDATLPEAFPASASGIRAAFLEHKGSLTGSLTAQLPSAEVYASYDGKPPLTEDAFSLLLLEKLRRIQGESLSGYFDVGEELSNRVWNCLDQYRSFSQFTDLIKTRNVTRTAVSRALLHILLDIRSWQPLSILRVLGFRREALPLLTELTSCASLPVVTSPADPAIPAEWLYGDRLYESVRSLLHGQPYQNEQRRRLLVTGGSHSRENSLGQSPGGTWT